MGNLSKLTQKELRHLEKNEITTERALTELFKAQQHVRNIYHTEPCWECKAIARRLGLLEE